MNILQVITSMNPATGGPCQAVRNLLAQTSALGHQMEVVCLDDPEDHYFSQELLPITALGRGRGPWQYHPRLFSWLKANLPRFDAAILNGLWQYPGYALATAARSPNQPPYYVFPHGMLDPWFQRAPGRRWKAARNWLHWKLIEQKVIHGAQGLLFTCAEEMRLARGTFRPYQPKHQVNVGFGVAQPPAYHAGMKAAFTAQCPGLNGRPFWLFLGRIHPKKGVDLLLRAYAEVCANATANGQEQVPRLVIAGPGLETLFGKQMQALATRLCAPGAVFWPGMLAGDAKWGALNHAEAFALISHQENFGIAVVEALACGTPVLISNQINIWREIRGDGAGLVADDTLEGGRQLLFCWRNLPTEEKQAMKPAAKASFEKNFSAGLAAQKLLTTVQYLTASPVLPLRPAAGPVAIPSEGAR